MADHKYVDLVLGWLRDEWNSANYPGSGGDGGGLNGKVPAFIDGDDGTSHEYGGRKVHYDLSKNNAVEVNSSPDRLKEAVGTEFDYSFEDGVSIRVLAMPADVVDHGASIGVQDSTEFRSFYREVLRVLANHKEWPHRNPGGRDSAHTLAVFDESNLSGQYGDLYEYNITATVHGFDEL